MLSCKGTLSGKRLLRAESVELMTCNHLPNNLIPLDKKPDDRYGGLGFGLGVFGSRSTNRLGARVPDR